MEIACWHQNFNYYPEPNSMLHPCQRQSDAEEKLQKSMHRYRICVSYAVGLWDSRERTEGSWKQQAALHFNTEWRTGPKTAQGSWGGTPDIRISFETIGAPLFLLKLFFLKPFSDLSHCPIFPYTFHTPPPSAKYVGDLGEGEWCTMFFQCAFLPPHTHLPTECQIPESLLLEAITYVIKGLLVPHCYTATITCKPLYFNHFIWHFPPLVMTSPVQFFVLHSLELLTQGCWYLEVCPNFFSISDHWYSKQ